MRRDGGEVLMVSSLLIRRWFARLELILYPVLVAVIVSIVWLGWEVSKIKVELKPPVKVQRSANFVNFILEGNPNLTPAEVDFILSMVDAVHKVTGIKQELLLAIPRRESDFKPEAVSPTGAIGVLQVHPAAWADASADLEDGMRSGYMKFIHYYARENNNIVRALMSYLSGSPDGVPRGRGQRKDKEWVEKKKAEARRYVQDIFDYVARLERGEWAIPKKSGGK
jgi:hypothetical protein